jgi:hypothetical protein
MWDISWRDVAIGLGAAALVAGVAIATGGLGLAGLGALEASGVLAVGTTEVAGSVMAATGTVVGGLSAAQTLTTVLTGRDPSGRPVSDAQRSRALGALPVEAFTTFLGFKGIFGGPPSPGGSVSSQGALALNPALATVSVSHPALSGAGLLQPLVPALAMSMSGSGGGTSGGGEPSPSGTSNVDPARGSVGPAATGGDPGPIPDKPSIPPPDWARPFPAPVEGNAQFSTPQHGETSINVARALSEVPDTDELPGPTSVHLNQQMRTVTRGTSIPSTSIRRPDVVAKTKTDDYLGILRVEVPSAVDVRTPKAFGRLIGRNLKEMLREGPSSEGLMIIWEFGGPKK